jgi:hypothetical protein
MSLLGIQVAEQGLDCLEHYRRWVITKFLMRGRSHYFYATSEFLILGARLIEPGRVVILSSRRQPNAAERKPESPETPSHLFLSILILQLATTN